MAIAAKEAELVFRADLPVRRRTDFEFIALAIMRLVRRDEPAVLLILIELALLCLRRCDDGRPCVELVRFADMAIGKVKRRLVAGVGLRFGKFF